MILGRPRASGQTDLPVLALAPQVRRLVPPNKRFPASAAERPSGEALMNFAHQHQPGSRAAGAGVVIAIHIAIVAVFASAFQHTAVQKPQPPVLVPTMPTVEPKPPSCPRWSIDRTSLHPSPGWLTYRPCPARLIRLCKSRRRALLLPLTRARWPKQLGRWFTAPAAPWPASPPSRLQQ